MKLSQAIEIMRKFSEGGHIDPDLFEVFLRQGVFRRYAESFLDPGQIDQVPVKLSALT
jgi:HD-GYP domain-containing protein (c-di-GMP phosphodiesterase class II)